MRLLRSISGAGNLTVYARSSRNRWHGNTTNFTGALTIAGSKSGSYDPQFDFYGNTNLSRAAVTISVAANNNGNVIQLGNLKGNATLSGKGTWQIGALGDDIVFNGTVSGGKITKVGDGVWTMSKR